MYWFKNYYPNVPLNLDDDPFFLQCMNEIQGTNTAGIKCNILLDTFITIIKYN